MILADWLVLKTVSAATRFTSSSLCWYIMLIGVPLLNEWAMSNALADSGMLHILGTIVIHMHSPIFNSIHDMQLHPPCNYHVVLCPKLCMHLGVMSISYGCIFSLGHRTAIVLCYCAVYTATGSAFDETAHLTVRTVACNQTFVNKTKNRNRRNSCVTHKRLDSTDAFTLWMSQCFKCKISMMACMHGRAYLRRRKMSCGWLKNKSSANCLFCGVSKNYEEQSLVFSGDNARNSNSTVHLLGNYNRVHSNANACDRVSTVRRHSGGSFPQKWTGKLSLPHVIRVSASIKQTSKTWNDRACVCLDAHGSAREADRQSDGCTPLVTQALYENMHTPGIYPLGDCATN